MLIFGLIFISIFKQFILPLLCLNSSRQIYSNSDVHTLETEVVAHLRDKVSEKFYTPACTPIDCVTQTLYYSLVTVDSDYSTPSVQLNTEFEDSKPETDPSNVDKELEEQDLLSRSFELIRAKSSSAEKRRTSFGHVRCKRVTSRAMSKTDEKTARPGPVYTSGVSSREHTTSDTSGVDVNESSTSSLTEPEIWDSTEHEDDEDCFDEKTLAGNDPPGPGDPLLLDPPTSQKPLDSNTLKFAPDTLKSAPGHYFPPSSVIPGVNEPASLSSTASSNFFIDASSLLDENECLLPKKDEVKGAFVGITNGDVGTFSTNGNPAFQIPGTHYFPPPSLVDGRDEPTSLTCYLEDPGSSQLADLKLGDTSQSNAVKEVRSEELTKLNGLGESHLSLTESTKSGKITSDNLNDTQFRQGETPNDPISPAKDVTMASKSIVEDKVLTLEDKDVEHVRNNPHVAEKEMELCKNKLDTDTKKAKTTKNNLNIPEKDVNIAEKDLGFRGNDDVCKTAVAPPVAARRTRVPTLYETVNHMLENVKPVNGNEFETFIIHEGIVGENGNLHRNVSVKTNSPLPSTAKPLPGISDASPTSPELCISSPSKTVVDEPSIFKERGENLNFNNIGTSVSVANDTKCLGSSVSNVVSEVTSPSRPINKVLNETKVVSSSHEKDTMYGLGDVLNRDKIEEIPTKVFNKTSDEFSTKLANDTHIIQDSSLGDPTLKTLQDASPSVTKVLETVAPVNVRNIPESGALTSLHDCSDIQSSSALDAPNNLNNTVKSETFGIANSANDPEFQTFVIDTSNFTRSVEDNTSSTPGLAMQQGEEPKTFIIDGNTTFNTNNVSVHSGDGNTSFNSNTAVHSADRNITSDTNTTFVHIGDGNTSFNTSATSKSKSDDRVTDANRTFDLVSEICKKKTSSRETLDLINETADLNATTNFDATEDINAATEFNAISTLNSSGDPFETRHLVPSYEKRGLTSNLRFDLIQDTVVSNGTGNLVVSAENTSQHVAQTSGTCGDNRNTVDNSNTKSTVDNRNGGNEASHELHVKVMTNENFGNGTNTTNEAQSDSQSTSGNFLGMTSEAQIRLDQTFAIGDKANETERTILSNGPESGTRSHNSSDLGTYQRLEQSNLNLGEPSVLSRSSELKLVKENFNEQLHQTMTISPNQSPIPETRVGLSNPTLVPGSRSPVPGSRSPLPGSRSPIPGNRSPVPEARAVHQTPVPAMRTSINSSVLLDSTPTLEPLKPVCTTTNPFHPLNPFIDYSHQASIISADSIEVQHAQDAISQHFYPNVSITTETTHRNVQTASCQSQLTQQVMGYSNDAAHSSEMQISRSFSSNPSVNQINTSFSSTNPFLNDIQNDVLTNGESTFVIPATEALVKPGAGLSEVNQILAGQNQFREVYSYQHPVEEAHLQQQNGWTHSNPTATTDSQVIFRRDVKKSKDSTNAKLYIQHSTPLSASVDNLLDMNYTPIKQDDVDGNFDLNVTQIKRLSCKLNDENLSKANEQLHLLLAGDTSAPSGKYSNYTDSLQNETNSHTLKPDNAALDVILSRGQNHHCEDFHSPDSLNADDEIRAQANIDEDNRSKNSSDIDCVPIVSGGSVLLDNEASPRRGSTSWTVAFNGGMSRSTNQSGTVDFANGTLSKSSSSLVKHGDSFSHNSKSCGFYIDLNEPSLVEVEKRAKSSTREGGEKKMFNMFIDISNSDSSDKER